MPYDFPPFGAVELNLLRDNVQNYDKVIYLPVYMTMFLEQTKSEESIYKFDLTGL